MIEITIGQLGSGEETIEIEPGEVVQRSLDAPAYVEIDASELADGSDGDEEVSIEVADTTIEQEKTKDDDREWKVKAVKCSNCGNRYPKHNSKCDQCGIPNQGT